MLLNRCMDEDLIDLQRRIRVGDKEAEADLYCWLQRKWILVLGKIWDMVHRSGRSQDLMHDTFLRLIRAIQGNEIQKPGALFFYAHVVARRTHWTWHKNRNNRNDSLLEYGSGVLSKDSPERSMLHRENAALIRCAVARIRSQVRKEIIVRRYFLQQPKDEVMQSMKLSEASYRNYQNRALNDLARLMGHNREGNVNGRRARS